MINSKHMSSVMVIVAGNDITTSLVDFRGLLTFSRLGPPLSFTTSSDGCTL